MELAFSPEQVADLRQWNLIDEQIAELERNLPRIKAWLKPTPRVSDVRAALDPVVEAIENLERELKAVALPMPEKVEAFARLNLEADRLGFPIALPSGEGFPTVALAMLKPLLAVAKGAREESPEGRPEDGWGSRRYPATADARVILWISNALSMGWGKGEIDGFIQHMPKHHVPSHTDGFKAIASVVYSACLGGDDYDTVEAIKRFRKQDREARENSRGAMNEANLES